MFASFFMGLFFSVFEFYEYPRDFTDHQARSSFPTPVALHLQQSLKFFNSISLKWWIPSTHVESCLRKSLWLQGYPKNPEL